MAVTSETQRGRRGLPSSIASMIQIVQGWNIWTRCSLYSPLMDYTVGNALFVLLGVVSTERNITGYSIRKIVEERGMATWAGVGNSSIYVGLKKAEQEGLLASFDDPKRTGRGPKGRAYKLTRRGRSVLKKALEEALATSSHDDPRFNIALSAISAIDPAAAAKCLEQRVAFLQREYERLEAVRELQQPRPLAAELVFDRILNSTANDRDWSRRAASLIQPVASAGTP